MKNQVAEWKEKAERAEQEREQVEQDSKSRILGLENKLIHKFEKDDSSDDSAFTELLNMCKQEMAEILERIRKSNESEQLEEQLRGEIIEAEKRKYELKIQYEKEISEQQASFMKQLDDYKRAAEAKRKEDLKKHSELMDKQRELQKQGNLETELLKEKQKNEGLTKEIQIIKENIDNQTAIINGAKTEKDLMGQQIKKQKD